MSHRQTRRGAAALLVLAIAAGPVHGQPAAPEQVYVTDELRLGLYTTEETAGRAQRMLVSGDALTVLERSLMSIRVRTEQGDEGWVKTAYVVDTAPARRRIATVESEVGTLTQRLDNATAEGNTLRTERDRLATELAEAIAAIDGMPDVVTERDALRAELDAIGTKVPAVWLAAAAAISFVIGLALGYLWLDRRVRRQFGGVRVY